VFQNAVLEVATRFFFKFLADRFQNADSITATSPKDEMKRLYFFILNVFIDGIQIWLSVLKFKSMAKRKHLFMDTATTVKSSVFGLSWYQFVAYLFSVKRPQHF
jgi:hypothetical protein